MRLQQVPSPLRRVDCTEEDRLFTDLYKATWRCGYPGITFINRPVVRGHFALLARRPGSRGKLNHWADSGPSNGIDINYNLRL